jgi:hypothetical protein
MTTSISGTGGITFPDGSVQPAAASPYVNKNRIINGDFRIDQRNAGASVTPSADSFVIDRFKYEASQTSKFTIQQNAGSVTPPAGFINYLGFTTASAVTIGSSDYFQTVQIIEGLNIGDLGWGTADAKTVTLSFWVRSSLTGTFGGSLRNSAVNRSYPFSYTISTANTWEQKSITIAGDTSGTWLTTNGVGIRLTFGLGNGSTYSGTAGAWAGANYQNATGATSVVGTNGATFYITGVQLEVGSSATPFERRLYNQELANCQRYYQKFTSLTGNYVAFGSGSAASATVAILYLKYTTAMRASATLTQSNCGLFASGGPYAITSLQNLRYGSDSMGFEAVVASGLTAGQGCTILGNNNSSAFIELSAEL